MKTSIAKKLPVESVTDLADTIAETVAESIHRVGEYVPEHVPESVSVALNEGVAHGRRIGREVRGRLPGERRSSHAKHWTIVATAIGVVALALVIWRIRSNRRDADEAARDDWTMSESPSRPSNRVAQGVA